VPGGAVNAPYQLAPNERHVQLFDAAKWFSQPNPGVVGMSRWWPNSHVEAIPDGTPYFTQLVADLRAAKNGGAAHFAGWAFTKNSVLDPSEPWDLIPWQDDTRMLPFFQDLATHGCQLRFLANRLIMLNVDPLDDDNFAVWVMVLSFMTLMGAQGVGKLTTDIGGFGVLAGGLGIATLALDSTWSTDLVRTYAEPSWETFPDLAALGPGVAAWADYPAAIADNPLANGPLTLPGGQVVDDVTHFGVFHQKAVAIRRADGTYTTYLGGVDINSDRADTPIHRAILPYHDVHARVLGPAAQDVITTLDQRLTLAGLAAAFPPPGSGGIPAIPDVLPEEGQHLTQIARTYFIPRIGSGTSPFTFAQQGDTTIYDTIIAAIDQATDFIYIEDQYFTPNDLYVRKLLDAADPSRNIRALVLVVGLDNGQIFGDTRLTEVIKALTTSWGSRFRYGTPFRRYLNPTPASNVNLGRCLLRTALTEVAGQDRITIGPISRVPKAPFFCFVESELILVTRESPPDDIADDGRTFWVERGPDGENPRWGANVGKHEEGSPVLCVRVPSVYVHAKCMVIDDIFMTVGSANVNRRGHFHDGELNVFAVPQRLKNDPTNPARNMRCRLWAEHLGLSPEMGLSLLSDPLSALAYFGRSWYVGSPFQPFTFTGSTLTDVNFGTGLLSTLVGATLDSYKPVLWNTAVDPTTTADPDANVPGPEYVA
jgi:phosphatidylserine/phosphatidylglycerophosphate/cardiolipin synthase-like enzyme